MTTPYLNAPAATLDPSQANRVFLPPAADAVYLRADNNLQLGVFNAAAGVELVVRARILLPNGEVQAAAERCVPTTDRALSTFTIQTGEGWLLGVTVFATAGTPRVGQCFAVLDVIRGDGAAAIVLATVLQGYVTSSARLAYPGSPLRASTEGPGVLRSITGTDPGAGTEITETVPTNARWIVHAVGATLVTSATVANREPSIVFDDGANLFVRIPNGTNIPASTTVNLWAFHTSTYSNSAQGNHFRLAIPRLPLQGGMRVRTITTGLQAGDEWAAPQLLVEEWIED